MHENTSEILQPLNDLPLISVVTVTLNDKEGLKKTIESVMRQGELKRLEHIIVDGASSYDIFGLVAELGSNARCWSEPDGGLFDAMNKGIELATGTFVIFMNSGDCFAEDDIVREVKSAMSNETPDIIYGDSLEQLESGEVAYKRGRDMRWIGIGMNTHHQSFLYRRGMLNEKGIRYNLDYRLAGDYEFTLLCHRAARCTVRLRTPVSVFLSGGLSQVRYAEAHREQAKIREKFFNSRLFAHAILYAQLLNGLLRRRLPALYWRLKQ